MNSAGRGRALFITCVAFAFLSFSTLNRPSGAAPAPSSLFGVRLPVVLGQVGAAAVRLQQSVAKLSPALDVLLAEEDTASFLVVMEEQADLSHVGQFQSKAARGRAVYDVLRDVAVQAQAPLRAQLDRQGVAYRSFYIVNMLLVQGDTTLALSLAARPDVARLEANPAVRGQLPEADPQVALDANLALEPHRADGVEWGVARVRADDVWALGYTGQGVVVAGQDTGYDWDHPALKSQYRGWDGVTVTHDYSWHDAIHQDDPHTSAGNPCGFDSTEPCDDDGHGTHTMGTIVGDDGGDNQIGVAPGARWISCRNMEQGWGTPASYAECFEFFLAPYPVGGDPLTEGDPGKAPDVISNSWSCPSVEGCDAASLQTVVENVRAAGILVVVSAGNAGSSCGSVGAPPALHDASFAVGATDSGDQIASFSSRGPVTVDDSNRPKPDVSAPGVGVRSSIPGGSYGYKSGTSMAAPHVAGVAALLWSAAPGLKGQIDATETLIQDSARPRLDGACGGDADGHPNNVYGWGIIDALAGINQLLAGLQAGARAEPRWVAAGGPVTYTFTVSNTALLAPATGVVLSNTLPASTTLARASGTVSFTADGATWNLGVISPGQRMSVTLVVTVDSTVLSGTQISNANYWARSNEHPTPVNGLPALVSVFREADPVALQVVADANRRWVRAGGVLSYTITVSNLAPFAPASNVVLTDVLPAGTALARASGDYVETGRSVSWKLGTLGPGERTDVALAVTVGVTLTPGSLVANVDYSVRSSESVTTALGPPAVALVPWERFVPIILRHAP
jgi:serine protease AprX